MDRLETYEYVRRAKVPVNELLRVEVPADIVNSKNDLRESIVFLGKGAAARTAFPSRCPARCESAASSSGALPRSS